MIHRKKNNNFLLQRTTIHTHLRDTGFRRYVQQENDSQKHVFDSISMTYITSPDPQRKPPQGMYNPDRAVMMHGAGKWSFYILGTALKQQERIEKQPPLSLICLGRSSAQGSCPSFSSLVASHHETPPPILCWVANRAAEFGMETTRTCWWVCVPAILSQWKYQLQWASRQLSEKEH